MSTSLQAERSPWRDSSLWLLLLSNIVTICFAITENWNLSTIMWVYWSQSVIIGFFNILRILQLNEPPRHKYSAAIFFLVHYGLFHMAYFSFLLTSDFPKMPGGAPAPDELKYVLLTAGIFFFNHLYSYFYNKSRDIQQQSIRLLMKRPYARIIPMHLTLIFGSIIGGALIIFLILKTAVDVMAHIKEHNTKSAKIVG